MSQTIPRARPLPAELRRESIVAAATPLVREYGRRVTTRQIAVAAQVSEGTLFHVFTDKDAIVEAVFEAEMSPDQVLAELAAIDRSLPLPERITVLVEIMQRRLGSVFELLTAVGFQGRAERLRQQRKGPVLDAVADVLRPGSDGLRLTPEETARVIRMLTFATTHPALNDEQPMSADRVAAVLCCGVLTSALAGAPPVLIPLLRTYLRPYARPLLAVVVLQLAATIASLYLPTLNADIIDNGVSTGDTGYIVRVGIVMLAITLVQVVCTIVAVWFGARTAMAFGRDVRGGVFHAVGRFSAREMAGFGAPTLITRTTNDVQQLQILVLLSCTLMVTAPIAAIGGVIMAVRQDLGLSWLIVVSVSVLVVAITFLVSRLVPLFRLMQQRIDVVNRVLREQITGIRVVRAFVREPLERARFGAANDDLTKPHSASGGCRRSCSRRCCSSSTCRALPCSGSVAIAWVRARCRSAP